MPPTTSDEHVRLAALEQLAVLDTSPEHQFDNLVQAAALACRMPISLLTLIDADRQWFKASVGLPGVAETPRDWSFCSHAIEHEGVFEIPDATTDARFAENPMVVGVPEIRFYAGSPLCLTDGSRVGTLCVIDNKPGRLTSEQRTLLNHLAAAAVKMLEARRIAYDLAVSEARFRALSASAPLGVFATDAGGLCTYTNERWQTLFDMANADALGDGWTRNLHQDDKATMFAEWRRTASLSLDFESEFRVRHDDGTERRARVVSRPVFSADGDMTGHVGSVEDITDHVLQLEALERANQRLTAATESGHIGIWEWDVRSEQVNWTLQMFTLFGMSPQLTEITREVWLDRVHPEDRESVVRDLREAIAGNDRSDTEYRIIRGDGSVRHLRASARVMLDIHGKPERLLGVSWDVTSLRQLGDQLSRQHELLRVTLQSIGDAVITTDASGRVTWQNPVAERMTGWLSADAVGQPLAQVFHIVDEQTRRLGINPVMACLEENKVTGLAEHTSLIRRDGTERSIEDSAAPILDRHGALLGAVLVFHDVTEQRRLAREMTHRATHDALTGLVNRAEFETRLQYTLDQAKAEGSDNALMFIDLDQFKLVNDACGHSVGDELLSRVARLLASTVRGNDTLARLGGDEFGVILENCSSDQALRVAQQICDRMEGFRFTHEQRRFRIGASIGLAPLDRRWSDAAAAMQAADISCYAAKEAGRNRVHLWFDTDQALLDREGDLRWATRLEQALDEHRFELFVQRIKPLYSGGTDIHAEVLLRLRESDGSLVMPNAFLPSAERYHFASRIDRWVLKKALEQLARNSDVDLLYVNLSGRSIGDRLFHRQVIELLQVAGNALCRRLCLEVPETEAVTNLGDAALFIDRVRSLEVRVALGDFGAGASSFSYLRTLQVDLLKIDRQFINGLIDDPLSEASVRCFVDVARVMGLKTVAQYVDNPRTIARVRELGIDYAQGFQLHEPEPIDLWSSKLDNVQAGAKI